MNTDNTIETVTETIKCPQCGQDATFEHEKDQTFGVYFCRHCWEASQ